MAEWWENDPVVEDTSQGNWWESDPEVGQPAAQPDVTYGETIETTDPNKRFVPGVPMGDDGNNIESFDTETKDKNGNWVNERDEISSAQTTLDKNRIYQKNGKEILRPGTQMYDGLEGEAAEELYKMYLDSPNTVQTPTGPAYKGTLIPPPNRSLLKDIPVVGDIQRGVDRVGMGAAQAATQMAQDIGITGAAIADEGLETIGVDTNMAKTVDEWLGDYNPQGFVDNIVAEGTKGAIAAAAANKIGRANKDVRNMKDVSPAGQPMTQGQAAGKVGGAFVKSEAIYAAGSNESSELGFGGVINDKSIGLLKDKLGIKSDGDYSSKELQTKMNVFTEGLVASGIMEGVMRAGIGAGKFVKGSVYNPLSVFFSEEALKKKVVRDMLSDAVKGLPANATPDQIMAAKQRVRDYIADPDNHEELMNIGVQGLDKIQVKNTTLQALEKGAKADGDDALARRAFETEVTQQKLDLPKTKETLSNQEATVDDSLTRIEDSFGGETARAEGKDHMINVKDQEAQRVRDEYDRFAQETEGKSGDLSGLLKDDPKLGPIAQEVQDAGIKGKSVSQGQVGKMTDTLQMDERTLKAEETKRWKAFDAAAKDMPLNPEFKEVYERARPYLHGDAGKLKIDKQGPVKPSEMETRLKDDPEGLALYRRLKGNLDEGKPPEDTGMTYGEVIKNVTKEDLKREIKAAINTGQDSNKINALKDLQDNLFGKQEEFMGAANPELKTLIEDARSYSRDTYQTVYDKNSGGPMGAIRKGNDKERPFDGYPDAGQNLKADNRKKIGGLIQTSFTDNGREWAPVVLKRLEANGKKDDAETYVIAVGMEAIANKLRGKSHTMEPFDHADELEVNDIFQSMQKTVSNMSPEGAKHVENLMKVYQEKKGNLKELMPILEKEAENARLVEQRLMGSELKEFFDEIPNTKNYDPANPNFAPTNNTPTQVFDGIIRGENPIERITQIKTIADQQPNAQVLDKALKSAWYRNFRTNLMTQGQIDTKVIDSMRQGNDKTLQVGEYLFQNDPVFQATREVAEIVGGRKLDRDIAASRKGNPINPNDIKREASVATNQIITFALGVLNTLASRTRIGTSQVMDKLDPKSSYLSFIDEINANPKLFTSLADEVLKDDKYLLTPSGKDAILKFISKAGYNMGDNDEDIRAAMEAQLGTANDIADETTKALGIAK